MRPGQRLLAAVLLSGTLVVPSLAALAAPPPPGTAAGDGEGLAACEQWCGPSAPGEWKARQDLSGGHGLPRRALLRAADEASRLPVTGAAWSAQGPSSVGGRVTGLAVDPALADTVYLAAASGGVWKSSDKGMTYQPAWSDTAPQAVGALAAASDGTLYAGTGEANPGGGSMTYEGDGVYKSTDRGATWQNTGLPTSATFGAIAVHPANPAIVYAAATGSLFRGGGDRGVYRTADAGATWQRVLAGPNATTGAVDVVIDPSNPNRVYAALWDRLREPDLRRYGGTGSGLYRSNDGGATWTRLSNVTTKSPGDTVGLDSSVQLGRIGVAVASTGKVYVITSTYGSYGHEKGFYASTDNGASFTTTGLPGVGGAVWWTGKVWVDPANANHVFAPGVSLKESTNGGSTWGSIGGMHVDHHAMAWDSKVPGRVYEGNDGGAYRSDSNGGNNSWIKGTVQPFTQFYSVAVSAQDATRISGGTQDNGSLRTWGGTGWNSYYGGDGEQNLINPANQENVFACSQNGACGRSTNGGSSMQSLGGATSARFNWFSPLEFARDNPSTVYFGGERLNRSTNGGQSFSVISPDLSGGPGRDPAYPYGTLTTVSAEGPVIYAGTDDGRVWVSTNSGSSWRLALSGQPWVTRVKIDGSRAYVTLSGYRAGSGAPQVLATSDAGLTWQNITGNLPQAPVNDIVTAPGDTLLVATDVGVFTAAGRSGVWSRLGTGLPLAPVTDIEYHAATGAVFAATFGRGIYRVPLGTGGGTPLANGGFETGNLTGWTSTGTASAVTSPVQAGTYAARLGAANKDSAVSQAFTVQSGQSTLALWYRMNCVDTVQYDWATVTLTNNTTGTTATLLPRTCATSGSFLQLTAAVTAGTSYTLRLVSHADSNPNDLSTTVYDSVTVS
ncbi:VPS10 domain-containing protein [Longispora albida]|uniref:VPS10 domain-containing protein n=1 Tax=Longispora albida TaxID=203523 RepID=UPI0003A6EA5E|nr:exo-alpha-sialidase [Longispora albida]